MKRNLEKPTFVLKHVMPKGQALRRLPLGIARGRTLEIDFSHQSRMYFGLYEIELNRYLREICFRGANCFDVGGQHGYDSLVLAKLTGGRVLTFECDTAAVETMRRVFAENQPLPVEVVQCTVARGTDPSAEQLSLDDAASHPQGFRPDVIKIDVDGAEVEVLNGARRLLSLRRPHLIVETHSPELERECATLLKTFGYRPSVINQRRWLRDHRPIAHNRWLLARGGLPTS